MAGTLASAGFRYLIGIINVVVLIGIWRVFTAMRSGRFNERDLEDTRTTADFSLASCDRS